jgi:bis(5'-nucleosyl)-tetraphosphatase (symmetrical)
MDYLVGDLQGCHDALEQMLATLAFSPSRDRLFVLGDLVNRGPGSLPTLRRLRGFDASAVCLLGNHDLHLLAVAHGVRKAGPNDTLAALLAAPERDALLDWLRQRPLALQHDGWLLVHAGVVPQWDAAQTLQLAAEVQQRLAGPDVLTLLQRMYGNQPARWSDDLQGDERARFVINALTRLRYCSPDGTMLLHRKHPPSQSQPDELPWFDVPGRRTAGQRMACGHWSVLGLLDRADVLAIDTGCVWGGALTAVRVDGGRSDVVQVACDQAQAPGEEG